MPPSLSTAAAEMARRMVWSPLRDDVQAGVDVDGIAGHPGGRAADQERHHPSDLGDVHQPVRGRSADRGPNQFVELRDAAGGPGLQRPGRHGEYADAVLSQFRAKGPQLDRAAMGELCSLAMPTTRPRRPRSMSPTRLLGSHTVGNGSTGPAVSGMIDLKYVDGGDDRVRHPILPPILLSEKI